MRMIVLITFLVLPLANSASSEDAPLKKKIREFRVRNGSVQLCLHGLLACGVKLCFELIPENQIDSWIDNDGHLVFKGTRFTVESTNVTVEALLNQIVEALPQYKWELVKETGIINFLPKSNSMLNNPVAPSQKAIDISLLEVEGMKDLGRRTVWRGEQAPIVMIDFPGGSQRDFLNTVSFELDSTTSRLRLWHLKPYRGFMALHWRERGCQVDRVRLDYTIKTGTPIDQSVDLLFTKYDCRYTLENEEMVMLPNRVERDLAVESAPIALLSNTFQPVIREFYRALRAALRHDVDGFIAFCDADGVSDSNKSMSQNELRKEVMRFSSLNDKSRHHLVDLIDPKTLDAKEDGNFIQCVIPIREELRSIYGNQIEMVFARNDKLLKIVEIRW